MYGGITSDYINIVQFLIESGANVNASSFNEIVSFKEWSSKSTTYKRDMRLRVIWMSDVGESILSILPSDIPKLVAFFI